MKQQSAAFLRPICSESVDRLHVFCCQSAMKVCQQALSTNCEQTVDTDNYGSVDKSL